MRASRVLLQVVATIAVLTGAATSPALAAAPAGPSVTGAWPTGPSGPAGTEAQVIAAAADPVWSAPVTAVPDRGRPSDVSCPTTTWCMAVDLSGQALTFDGHRWSPPRKVFPKAPGQPQVAVSCPTTSFCLAVSAYGYGVYRSGTWTVVRSSLAPFRTVGCYSATRCALVMGDAWSAHRMAYWNGSTLTTSVNMPWAVRVDSVACVSATTCHAIGVEPKGGAIALRSSGATWVASYLRSDHFYSTFDLSCTAATFCLATSRTENQAWSWNGSAWRDAGVTRSNLILSPETLSCSSPTSCQAVGGERVGRWNGSSWSVQELYPVVGGTYAVDCATSTTCVVVDNRGRFWRGGGATWTRAASFDPTSRGLADLSCPTSTFCMATDATGNAVRWTGSGWTGMARLGTMASSVSCLSATWCMTVDSQQSTSRIWTGSWGPATPVDYITVLRPGQCASTTACFVFEAGDVRRWNGRSWSAPVRLFTTQMDVRIACAGPRFCVAMTDEGLFRTWNGISWSSARLSGVTMANQLTCTSSTFCMAESDGSLYSTFDGTTWAVRRTLPAGGGAFGCQSSTRCLVATRDGTVYRWSGGPWVANANRIGFLPRELVCTPTRCMAMSDDQASWTL